MHTGLKIRRRWSDSTSMGQFQVDNPIARLILLVRRKTMKIIPDCKHCDDTGLVPRPIGTGQELDPCQCLLENGISVFLRGGGVKLSFVEGGGVILKVSDHGGADGSPSDQLKFVVERSDLKKLIKAMKKAKGIMKVLKQK